MRVHSVSRRSWSVFTGLEMYRSLRARDVVVPAIVRKRRVASNMRAYSPHGVGKGGGDRGGGFAVLTMGAVLETARRRRARRRRTGPFYQPYDEGHPLRGNSDSKAPGPPGRFALG
jgi:hypothetical protein